MVRGRQAQHGVGRRRQVEVGAVQIRLLAIRIDVDLPVQERGDDMEGALAGRRTDIEYAVARAIGSGNAEQDRSGPAAENEAVLGAGFRRTLKPIAPPRRLCGKTERHDVVQGA